MDYDYDYDYLKNYLYSLFPLFYCDKEYEEEELPETELPHAVPINIGHDILISEHNDNYCVMVTI